MLKNEFLKYKLIKLTLSTLCLCTLLGALLSVLSVSVAHASSRCADIVSSSFSSSDSSMRDLPPSNTNTSMKNSPGSSSMSAIDFYSNSKTPAEITKGLQSYIGELLEKRIIGDPELIRFIEHLERGELINPISQDEARTSTALLVQRKGLQKYLDKSSLNQKELLAWSRATLEKRARVRVQREETREETRNIYQDLEFHPVKRPARFKVGGGNRGKQFITLTYPIEVQSTPMTQKQWVEVMGENPSYFAKDGNTETEILNLHGKNMELQPDNPVEGVTWWSALVFANRLSEQHGLPPAYDLSGIDWNPATRAEDGTLQPMREENKGEKIRVYVKGKSHDPYEGDIYYRAEGYRLPTAAEQDYMFRGGGKAQGDSFFKDESDLAKHAWYLKNADGQTHPVGLLQPIVIDGKDFHEIYGNVDEWGWDWGWYDPYRSKIRYGKNPVSPTPLLTEVVESEPMRQSSGGAWSESLEWFEFSIASSLAEPYGRYDYVGFRLVRTIEPGDGEPGDGE